MQLLLYTGGIITLMLFAVMLVRRGADAPSAGELSGVGRAVLPSTAVFALVALAVVRGGLPDGKPASPSAKLLGDILLGPLALPFEALSVLLLAAMVGAITLARRKDPES
jgi:NADH-quinone oxidoreductase subunit J